MRMWMMPASAMCRNHLLGEHRELHMLIGALHKGISLSGYIANGLVDPSMIYSRHEELVDELVARRYLHKSPMTEADYKVLEHLKREPIPLRASYIALLTRCDDCKAKAKAWVNKYGCMCERCETLRAVLEDLA
jgi:hypothetical protein